MSSSPKIFYLRTRAVWFLSEAGAFLGAESGARTGAQWGGGCSSSRSAQLWGSCLENDVLGEKDGKPLMTSLSPGPGIFSGVY